MISETSLAKNPKRLIFRIQHPVSLSICFISVQPLSADEDGGHPVSGVGDLHTLQIPSGRSAVVVVLHSDPQELTQIQHLQQKAVCPSSLKQVPVLPLQRSLPRVSVDAVERDEDVGVGGGVLHVSGDDDDLVFDGNQTAHFAGEALHGFAALKRHELVSLGRQRDPSVAGEVESVEDKQRERRSEQDFRKGYTILDFADIRYADICQIILADSWCQ